MQFLLSRVQDKNDDTGILLDMLMMLTALQMPDMALCHMQFYAGFLIDSGIAKQGCCIRQFAGQADDTTAQHRSDCENM